MKRILDVTLSLLALLLFAPLGALIVLVLAVTGEKEIFYRQPRVGKDGELFDLLKFATMLKASPQMGSKTITVKNDPRVLPVGKFLRKTKLNEVPQLLNVLRGDMSIVGPRPLTPETFGYYPAEVQDRITVVQPGLTGIGSIHFRNEEAVLGANSKKSAADTYRESIAPYKGKLELWYIENRSNWLDLKLIFLTAIAVLFPRSELHKRILTIPPS